jgi:hypothetical protein
MSEYPTRLDCCHFFHASNSLLSLAKLFDRSIITDAGAGTAAENLYPSNYNDDMIGVSIVTDASKCTNYVYMSVYVCMRRESAIY